MTPAARVAAAIGILDAISDGAPVERVLTQWGRNNRYAGSGDRAAIRDHVFDALRRRRSYAAFGGSETGRGVMLGALRATGVEPTGIFTGQGHAPPPLTNEEARFLPPSSMSDLVACDMPDWLHALFHESLGDAAVSTMMVLRDRAPVHLRVNLRKIDIPGALAALASDGIGAEPHGQVKTALQLTENERKLKSSTAYLDGLVELQDAASQAAMLRLPLTDGAKILDYCAGGGGKALAMGALAKVQLFAHDSDAGRMADLPTRAARAGLIVAQPATGELARLAPFELVLIDAPCSGSGTWRRAPEAKWRLTADGLAGLCRMQAQILDQAARLVRPQGTLAYATCSVLRAENRLQVDSFLARTPGWLLQDEMRLLPGPLHDGFYLAVLQCASGT